ncbi:gamma-glutamyltransferase family protein [Candidatus Marinimicrobia bacterium]|nr:gamma-glutamyltransferase family protein [Candidatus Neomarinimicrobiota bacterium]MDA9735571.1 gamma-glutamyltransferase family protein [Candidatus Neomarinimicrobiota bacterium]
MKKNLNYLFLILATFSLIACELGSDYTKTNQNLKNKNGAVSSTSSLASAAGIDIMKKGGNAFDAIVATGFTLAVTSPSNGNIGGGGFMVARTAEGEIVTLDFREKAPTLSYETMFLDQEGNYSRNLALLSHKSSGVPGTVDGLIRIFNDYGSGNFTLNEILSYAIDYAENGHAINKSSAWGFDFYKHLFLEDKGSTEIFIKNYSLEMRQLQEDVQNETIPEEEYIKKMRDIKEWNEGDIIVQKDLAKTLKRIATNGRDGFYEGETADLIVSEMKANNGLISYEDLKEYNSVYRKPIIGSYRGYTIISMGPPSSGGPLIIQMLNMLENFDVSSMTRNSTEFVHMLTEIQRLAYADRAIHLGDPDFYPSPVPMLISKDYAKKRLELVSMDKATPSTDIAAGSTIPESMETTHYSAMDKLGNTVGITTTINLSYGNKKIVDGAGFLLNNEMDDFASSPGSQNAFGLIGYEANSIKPAKRPLSSMSPTIVLTPEGEPLMTIGAAGGSRIITTVLQVIISVVDHNLSVQDAINLGRTHSQWIPDVIRYEGKNKMNTEFNQFLPSLSEKQISELEKLDHKFEDGNVESGMYYLARAHGIMYKKGQFFTGVDWRGNGEISDGITY